MTDRPIYEKNQTLIDKTPFKVDGRKPVCCFWTDIDGVFHHKDGGSSQYRDYSGPDRTINASPPPEYRKPDFSIVEIMHILNHLK